MTDARAVLDAIHAALAVPYQWDSDTIETVSEILAAAEIGRASCRERV